jgi:hypothetical protein
MCFFFCANNTGSSSSASNFCAPDRHGSNCVPLQRGQRGPSAVWMATLLNFGFVFTNGIPGS